MIVFGTDFDDTLYFHDGRGIQDSDAQAIRSFQQGGDQFGLVSGRSRFMKEQIDEMLEGKVDFDFRVYSNGACICDKNCQVLSERFLPEAAVRELYERYPDVTLIFHGQNGLYLSHPKPSVPGQVIDSIEQIDPAKVYAISYSHQTPEGKRVLEENRNRNDIIMVSNSRFTDFGPLDVSKGKALNFIAHTLYGQGTTSAAIGDSWNDLPMLEEADESFTFHSSPADVRKAATHEVDSVAQAIEMLERKKAEKTAQ